MVSFSWDRPVGKRKNIFSTVIFILLHALVYIEYICCGPKHNIEFRLHKNYTNPVYVLQIFAKEKSYSIHKLKSFNLPFNLPDKSLYIYMVHLITRHSLAPFNTFVGKYVINPYLSQGVEEAADQKDSEAAAAPQHSPGS